MESKGTITSGSTGLAVSVAVILNLVCSPVIRGVMLLQVVVV
jgi:hypothetical protein